MKKARFPEPNCRYDCPFFKTSGTLLSETRYCMKAGRKGKRFRSKDPKSRPPAWCPRRITPPVCRIYGFKDEFSAAMDDDERLRFDPQKRERYLPSTHRYRLRCQGPGMSAGQFYSAVQEDLVETVLPEAHVKPGELIEIDDGLRPYYFYCYDSVTVIPATIIGALRKGSEGADV